MQHDGNVPAFAFRHRQSRDTIMYMIQSVYVNCRSECETRADDVVKQPALRMLAFDGGRLIELPKIANNYCLIHNAGVECTCVKQRSDSKQNDARIQNGETPRSMTSRLSNHSWMDGSDRERVRSRVIEGLYSKEYLRHRQLPPNHVTPRSRKAANPSHCVLDRPPKQCASSSNFINTWLNAGAGTPRFIKDQHRKK